MIIISEFKPAWWLRNEHLQTIFATLTRRLRAPIDNIERIELPDGDFVELAWAVNGLDDHAPLVVLIHGLGGGMDSTYVAGQLKSFNQRGWRAVLMLLRGAGHEPNRLARTYHSGETSDLDYILQILKKREPKTKKALVGISLGGNMVLKWLGEHPKQTNVDAAVAVSVPFVLKSVADRVHLGFSRLYQRHLLKRMRYLLQRKQLASGIMPPQVMHDLKQVSCFWTFDEFVTAPLHGFPHAHAYYREASSRPYLIHIQTPTLIIHALDDPFMFPDAIPSVGELSASVRLEISAKGGHVGFISGNIPGKPVYWLEKRIPDYLRAYL